MLKKEWYKNMFLMKGATIKLLTGVSKTAEETRIRRRKHGQTPSRKKWAQTLSVRFILKSLLSLVTKKCWMKFVSNNIENIKTYCKYTYIFPEKPFMCRFSIVCPYFHTNISYRLLSSMVGSSSPKYRIRPSFDRPFCKKVKSLSTYS